MRRRIFEQVSGCNEGVFDVLPPEIEEDYLNSLERDVGTSVVAEVEEYWTSVGHADLEEEKKWGVSRSTTQGVETYHHLSLSGLEISETL